MNPEIKAKWVAALRSGEYEQGRGSLLRDGKHCCLGVLCEIAVQENVITKATYDTPENSLPEFQSSVTVFDEGPGEQFSVLPEKVIDWAGLDGGNPIVDDGKSNLASLNDNAGLSFDEIADVIETQL